MTSFRVFSALLAAAALACAPTAAGPDAPAAEQASGRPTIQSGTSFGMCAGYCTTLLTVNGATATFLETSRGGRGDPQLPDRTRTLELTAREQADLYAALDTAAVHALAGVHGCPDCADGGAEYIELGRTRVTFENGRELAPIAPLQRQIRALRARFPR